MIIGCDTSLAHHYDIYNNEKNIIKLSLMSFYNTPFIHRSKYITVIIPMTLAVMIARRV
jgi:hypothetical protein